jgi:hypothetical protein
MKKLLFHAGLMAAAMTSMGCAAIDFVDIIVLQSPLALTLYNQFAQPLTEQEKSGMLPGVPMQVIRHNATLGDQITRVVQCMYRQQTFFILKDEKGTIIGDKSNYRLLKFCRLLGDTVEITTNETVAFSEKEIPARPSENMLKRGDLLILQFRFKSGVYVLQTAPIERFGWISMFGGDCWKHVKKSVVKEPSMTGDLHDRLSRKIESANTLYKTFFEQFNRSTGAQKSIPRWSETKSGPDLQWSLSPPYDQTGELDESNKLLVEGLSDIVFNKPVSVRYDKGRITVTQKAVGTP